MAGLNPVELAAVVGGFANLELVYDAKSEKLLGAHIIGGSVTEMLGEPTLAKQLGITARQIASTVHSHPTMYEGLLEATEEIL